MAVYIVTGKLGGGKTLASVGRIVDALNQGRTVATNLDLYPERFKKKQNKTVRIVRLPDKPKRRHLEELGKGYEGEYKGEKHNGLIVLDECGTWFNSRTWNDKERGPIIEWFLHARKLRWDVIFIIQDIEMLDKQAKVSLAEHTVFCRRLDKLRIPFIGSLMKMATGWEPRPPQVHIGIVKYGTNSQSITVDRWWYRGRELFPLYDTEQAFVESDDGNYTMLTPWHLVGRYEDKQQWKATALKIANTAVRMVLIPFLPILVFVPPARQCWRHNSRLS